MQTTYDDNGRPTLLTHAKQSAEVVTGFGYTYDAAGNVKTRVNLPANTTDSFAYDSTYQLTRADYGDGTYEAWKHDGLGNWMEYDKNGEVKTQTVSAMNEYTSFGGQAQGFDEAGNLISDGQLKRKYNFRNMLAAVTDNSDAPVAKYAYDAQNRRVTKTVNNTATKFIWDGWETIEEYANGQLSATYTHAPKIDEHLLMETNGQRYYYHGDMLNSVYAVTDDAGNSAENYEYSAFGVSAGAGNFNNPYKYTGRSWNPETGDYYYRYRNYNMAQGRFISRDRLPSYRNVNMYWYADDRPYDYRDPMGLFSSGYHEEMSKYAGRIWGLNDDDILNLANYSVIADNKPFQDDQAAHGMANEGQSYLDAEKAWNNFLDNKLDEAVEYCKLGNLDMTLFELGRAIHSAEDVCAGGHDFWHQWNGTTGKILDGSICFHLAKDFFPSSKEVECGYNQANDTMSRFFMKLITSNSNNCGI